ncbi:SGNH/GDSL hydrolase family protein [Mycobacterium sp. 663a-19]|uniref:Rv0518 family GDSL lipase n=1 Tax=Mycobacterium sp. 663a-19 TaxID=2986148 RepID=UPI002D1EA9AB|nr:GDSL lipase [Mycobacterium sp. 663a-19]MEB3983647.1 SGNH/GDSL hydrolase family protein [Mycobacterium sp. 663a-19]
MSRLTTFVMGLTLLVGVAFADAACPARVRAYGLLSVDSRLHHVAVIGDSYTTGTDEGGLGPNAWTARAWQALNARGVRVAADVAAEGKAGYAVPGDHGSVFEDLTARAVKPDDALVVFFGSRNDQGADQGLLAERARNAFDLARRFAPSARLLVIGPPWPTADVPGPMLLVRDVLNGVARAAGAAFVDPIGDRWFVDRPDLIGPDGVHPNDAGHEYLAGKIAPLIRMQLSR